MWCSVVVKYNKWNVDVRDGSPRSINDHLHLQKSAGIFEPLRIPFWEAHISMPAEVWNRLVNQSVEIDGLKMLITMWCHRKNSCCETLCFRFSETWFPDALNVSSWVVVNMCYGTNPFQGRACGYNISRTWTLNTKHQLPRYVHSSRWWIWIWFY